MIKHFDVQIYYTYLPRENARGKLRRTLVFYYGCFIRACNCHFFRMDALRAHSAGLDQRITHSATILPPPPHTLVADHNGCNARHWGYAARGRGAARPEAVRPVPAGSRRHGRDRLSPAAKDRE